MNTSFLKKALITGMVLAVLSASVAFAQEGQRQQMQTRTQTRTQTKTMEATGECPENKVEAKVMVQRQMRKGSNGQQRMLKGNR